jgi:type II secretory pathway pseudopilin PulG
VTGRVLPARAARRAASCGVRRAARRDHDTRGFTLVELLISITISTLIIGVLASAAILFFQRSGDNDRTYSDQASVQLLGSLFTADAQSATTAITNDASACGSSATALVSFVWSDAGTTAKASWFVETVAGAQDLVRRRCTNGTPIEKNDVAGVSATPTITCEPDCTRPTTVTIAGTTTNGAAFGISGSRRAS